MTTLAFAIIAFMFAMYVVLDGYDLGVGAISPIVARDDRERRTLMRAIGPFWNGNEVWLVAGGATLFAMFPKAFASAFSGFYLPLIVVLWLLMGRGIAMELRDHYRGQLWHQFWDAAFSGSSALLIVVLGVALGNLVRGVPLDNDGYFRGTFAFLLNPYSVSVACFALVALGLHASAFLTIRVEGAPLERAWRLSTYVWIATGVSFVAVTALTFVMRPDLFTHVGVLLAGAIATLAFAALRMAIARRMELAAFGASALFLAAMLSACAMTMFPYLLRDFPNAATGISVSSAAPSESALISAIVVTLVALAGVVTYTALLWPKLAGKVQVEE